MNGKVFPARNIAVSACLESSFIADPDKRREMGRRSLERINHWSFEEDIRGIREASLSPPCLCQPVPAVEISGSCGCGHRTPVWNRVVELTAGA